MMPHGQQLPGVGSLDLSHLSPHWRSLIETPGNRSFLAEAAVLDVLAKEVFASEDDLGQMLWAGSSAPILRE